MTRMNYILDIHLKSALTQEYPSKPFIKRICVNYTVAKAFHTFGLSDAQTRATDDTSVVLKNQTPITDYTDLSFNEVFERVYGKPALLPRDIVHVNTADLQRCTHFFGLHKCDGEEYLRETLNRLTLQHEYVKQKWVNRNYMPTDRFIDDVCYWYNSAVDEKVGFAVYDTAPFNKSDDRDIIIDDAIEYLHHSPKGLGFIYWKVGFPECSITDTDISLHKNTFSRRMPALGVRAMQCLCGISADIDLFSPHDVIFGLYQDARYDDQWTIEVLPGAIFTHSTTFDFMRRKIFVNFV